MLNHDDAAGGTALMPLDGAGLPADGFDYSALPADVAQRQRDRAGRIGEHKRRTVEVMGAIGRELIAAQAEMEHGTFLRWVEAGAGLSKSAAYRFMNLVTAFGDDLPKVGGLPEAFVHKLAEKATPEPIRAAVLRRVNAGEVVKADAVLDEVREAREAARKRVEADREAARRAALSQAQREREDALRARGERGRAARARRDAQEQEARDAAARREDEEAQRGAEWLVVRLGADNAAAFFARFGSYGMRDRVLKWASLFAHEARGYEAPVTAVPVGQVERSGEAYAGRRLTPEAQARIAALAAAIGAGEDPDPVILLRQPGAVERYAIVEGVERFRALVDVLDRPTIPARIAPPAAPLAGLPGDP